MNMDIQTVMEIIAMLDTRIDHYHQLSNMDDDLFGEMWGLKSFRDHLQEYIELQVNQVENDMNGGQ
jgi:hypothetical protein